MTEILKSLRDELNALSFSETSITSAIESERKRCFDLVLREIEYSIHYDEDYYSNIKFTLEELSEDILKGSTPRPPLNLVPNPVPTPEPTPTPEPVPNPVPTPEPEPDPIPDVIEEPDEPDPVETEPEPAPAPETQIHPVGDASAVDLVWDNGVTMAWRDFLAETFKRADAHPEVKVFCARDTGTLSRQRGGGGGVRFISVRSDRKARAPGINTSTVKTLVPSGPMLVDGFEIRPENPTSTNQLVNIGMIDGLTLVDTDIMGDLANFSRNGIKGNERNFQLRFAMYGGSIFHTGNWNVYHGSYYGWEVQSALFYRVLAYDTRGSHTLKLYGRRNAVVECKLANYGNPWETDPEKVTGYYGTTILDLGTFAEHLIRGNELRFMQRHDTGHRFVDMRNRHVGGWGGPDKRMAPLYGPATWTPNYGPDGKQLTKRLAWTITPHKTGGMWFKDWWTDAALLNKYFLDNTFHKIGNSASARHQRTKAIECAGTLPARTGSSGTERPLDVPPDWFERARYYIDNNRFEGDLMIQVAIRPADYPKIDAAHVMIGQRGAPPAVESFINDDNGYAGGGWYYDDLHRSDVYAGTDLIAQYDKYPEGKRQRLPMLLPDREIAVPEWDQLRDRTGRRIN